MSKLFWYIYFVIYLFITTVICKINIFFLRKKSVKAADEYVYKAARGIAKHIIKISRSKTIVKGLENIPKEACIFVCNHQAIFDVFLLISNIEISTGFIAKKEIKKYPLITLFVLQGSKFLYIYLLIIL